MSHKVAIIGAGLAGCSLAYELSKNENLDITVFDKNSKIASEASGNYAGILKPHLTSDNNYSDQFHTLGYQILLDFINENKDNIEICSKGVLHILSNQRELQRYTKIFAKRDISPKVAILINSTEASKLLNSNTNHSAVFYPNAVSLVPSTLCELWLKLSKANTKLDSELVNISKTDTNKWMLSFINSDYEFDAVIFTGAYQLFQNIKYLKDIPVFSSHGQLTLIDKSVDINITAMNGGYIIPNYRNNMQILGATFRDSDDNSYDVRVFDNNKNIDVFKNMFIDKMTSDIIVIDSSVSTRCITTDHMPVVGKLVCHQLYKEMFEQPLSKGYPKSKMPNVIYENGLYVSSGFGSKGLCSSLIASKIIASDICNNESIVSIKLLESLSPQRFWIRNFKQSGC